MNRSMKILVTGIVTLACVPALFAGPYTDDLSRCLVESTTDEDRVNLVKWMFASASAHPAVQPLSTVSEEQLESANREMGELLMRLLTESCVDATKKAIKYEGEATIQTSFQVLGQVAGQELFASPEVTAALSGLDKYLDKEKLQALGDDE